MTQAACVLAKTLGGHTKRLHALADLIFVYLPLGIQAIAADVRATERALEAAGERVLADECLTSACYTNLQFRFGSTGRPV